MTAPAVSGSFFANVYPAVGTPQPLTVSQFIASPKPGNVAVCLSGGGSRALSAGMGQLNALQTLQLTPNATLLSQVKGTIHRLRRLLGRCPLYLSAGFHHR